MISTVFQKGGVTIVVDWEFSIKVLALRVRIFKCFLVTRYLWISKQLVSIMILNPPVCWFIFRCVLHAMD